MMSEKNKRIIVINNYKFDFDQMLPHGVESYVCTENRECHAYAKCFNNSRYILSSNLIHNHSPDSVQIINGQNVSNSYLQNPIASTSIITKYTDIVYINTNMYDSRYSAILKLPHNRREVHAELNSYEEVFQTIQNYCVIFNHEFNIKIVYVDFEKNLHNAVHQIWPRTTPVIINYNTDETFLLKLLSINSVKLTIHIQIYGIPNNFDSSNDKVNLTEWNLAH
ncbi:hypothetical protein QTP88_019424 [Uroleucon formosanum]